MIARNSSLVNFITAPLCGLRAMGPNGRARLSERTASSAHALYSSSEHDGFAGP
jgi:hypothetical protein